MKTVLITGANGFIGRHLIEVFKSNGFKVLAGVRKKSNTLAIDSSDIEVVRLNYLDSDSLKSSLDHYDISVVVHNAGVTVSKNRNGYFLGNTRTTENLLAALAQQKIDKFIYMSSLAARGPGRNSVDSPISPYGESKLEAESLVRRSGMAFAIVRPTAVYGPGDAAFGPVFEWAQRGIFLQLGSSRRKMTFIYVHDLAKLVYSSIGSTNRILYGWDGVNYLQRDLTNAIKEATKKKGLVLSIPSWMFRLGTALIDVFVRRIFNAFWEYPPMKVVELVADDWSILEGKKPDNICFGINEGFLMTFEQWNRKRK